MPFHHSPPAHEARIARPELSLSYPTVAPLLGANDARFLFSKTFGGGTRIRTGEWRFCRPLPYHLAIPPLLLTRGTLWYYELTPLVKQFYLFDPPGK